MKSNKITIAAIISADAKKIWDCWTQPEHIVKWNFATDEWYCPKAENDLKKGGKFSSTMASKDGKMSFDFGGVYDEIIDQEKIAYTMADGRQVTIDFEPLNGKTIVTETFDPEDTHAIETQKAGWQSILNNFKKYVETE